MSRRRWTTAAGALPELVKELEEGLQPMCTGWNAGGQRFCDERQPATGLLLLACQRCGGAADPVCDGCASSITTTTAPRPADRQLKAWNRKVTWHGRLSWLPFMPPYVRCPWHVTRCPACSAWLFADALRVVPLPTAPSLRDPS